MRKVLLIIFLLTIPLAVNAAELPDEPPGDYREAMYLVNRELESVAYPDYFQEQNEAGRQFNENLWENRELFVYGEPHGDFNQGNNRYLGYTMVKDEDFTNIKYPHDEWSGGHLEDRNWIEEPWRKNEVKNAHDISANRFDQNEEYRQEILPYIQEGLDQYYGTGTKGADGEVLHSGPRLYKNEDSKYHDEWYKYVHILQPPTEYTWGMGRIFHERDDGSIWYLTVPIVPLNYDIQDTGPDFSVTLDKDQVKTKAGEPVELTATFKLNEEYETPAEAELTAFHEVGNGEYPIELEPVDPENSLNDGVIEFYPGESKKYKLKATAQGSNSKMIANIEPMSGNDVNPENNRDEAQIKLNQNLWVEVDEEYKEVTEGNSVNLNAIIHNDSGGMVNTRLVWKKDGQIIEDNKNYDLVSEENSSVTINPSVGTHTVTVEVNPDRDRPANESTYEDNKEEIEVNVTPVEEESGDIEIIGPDTIEAYTPYEFTVKISGYLPYEKYTCSNGHTHYRSVDYNLTCNTNGEGVRTYSHTPGNPYGNPQKTEPVEKSWSESYTRSSGQYTKTINYKFPGVGMVGKSKSTLTIEASATRAGTARKVVNVNPRPVTEIDLDQTL